MPTVTMSEADRTQASQEGRWFPLCPHCQMETPAELDAELITCIHCDALVEIDN